MIKAGATTLNIPDTVGWSMPHEYQALVAGIKANTPGVEHVVLSTHCHDDLGLAAANSLAGVMAGRVLPSVLCWQVEEKQQPSVTRARVGYAAAPPDHGDSMRCHGWLPVPSMQ